jgi:hypothetical protein
MAPGNDAGIGGYRLRVDWGALCEKWSTVSSPLLALMLARICNPDCEPSSWLRGISNSTAPSRIVGFK